MYLAIHIEFYVLQELQSSLITAIALPTEHSKNMRHTFGFTSNFCYVIIMAHDTNLCVLFHEKCIASERLHLVH